MSSPGTAAASSLLHRVHLDERMECALHGSGDDTKHGAVAEPPQGCAVIQQGLHQLENWAKKNIMIY